MIGGGALLAFAAASAGAQFLTAGLGIGAVGAAGAAGLGVAQMTCMPPFCRADSGQCCTFINGINGIECPDSC